MEASTEFSSSSKMGTKTRMTTATMKLERYYSSVREEVSPLADDAFTLLSSQDYVHLKINRHYLVLTVSTRQCTTLPTNNMQR